MASSCVGRWIRGRVDYGYSKVRLFCFHHAGGSASIYNSWRGRLSDHVEVCAVQLPGRENRYQEAPYRSMDSLVDDLFSVLMGFVDQPYAFFGHSMGASVAFELACRFNAEGFSGPRHLFLAGMNPPHLQVRRETVDKLSHDEFLLKLRDLGGTPDLVLENEELLSVLLPAVRADFEVLETYFHKGGISLCSPISVYGGTKDLGLTKETLREWKNYTVATCCVNMFQGGHFFVRESQKLLLREVNKVLDGCL